MRKRIIISGPLLAVMLSACTTAPVQEESSPSQPQEQAVVVSPKEASASSAAQTSISPQMLYQLLAAEIAGQRGALDVSLASYLDAMDKTADPRIAERATRIAVYSRDNQVALRAAQRWVELSPDDSEAHRTIAVLYIRMNQLQKARTHLASVLKMAENEKAEGFNMITSLLGREPDRKAAYVLVKELVQDYPDDPDAHYSLAQIAAHAGHADAAFEAINRAIELRPDWKQARETRSRILVSLGNKSAAIDELEGLVKQFPDDSELRLTYARVLLGNGDLESALEQFEILIEVDPKNPDILFPIALLTLETRNLDVSEGYFLRLLAMRQRSDESTYYLGRIEELRENSSKAIAWYEQVAAGDYMLESRLRAATLITKEGRLDDGAKRFAEIREGNPAATVRAYLVESDILAELNEYRRGVDLLTVGLEAYPQNHEMRYARAMMAERIDDLALLESDLRRILEEDPNHAFALNGLGYTLADRTQRYDEAYDLLKRALALRPDDAAVVDSVGWVLYRMGRYDESLSYLKRALALREDPEIAAHVGEVLWVRGEKDEAQAVWKRALQVAPANQVLKEVIERLAK